LPLAEMHKGVTQRCSIEIKMFGKRNILPGNIIAVTISNMFIIDTVNEV